MDGCYEEAEGEEGADYELRRLERRPAASEELCRQASTFCLRWSCSFQRTGNGRMMMMRSKPRLVPAIADVVSSYMELREGRGDAP